MTQVEIPGTELSIFPINLGTNTFGWTADEAGSHAVLDSFVAAGGNFLDTAESYPAWLPGKTGRESETIIGTWLAARGNRDDIVIATKVGDHPDHQTQDPAYIRTAIDGSLERLQTDYVDLYYAHRDDEVTPIAEVARVFDEIVRSGKARHIAVSNYSPARLADWFAAWEELVNRLTGRGTERDDAVRARLREAERELQAADEFDARIVNSDVRTAARELLSLVTGRTAVCDDTEHSQ